MLHCVHHWLISGKSCETNQLNSYMNKEGLSNVNQSAYKRLQSTETALLKIQNNVADSMDSYKAVALTLLDLLAAFYTIDHNILFNCLGHWFNMDGTVLMWIKSHLTNRRQKVKLGNAFSRPYGSLKVLSWVCCFSLFTPKCTWHSTPGTLTPVLLSSLSVLLVFKNGWMVSDWNLIQRKQNSLSLATDRPASLFCKISHPVSWKFCLPYQWS